MVREFLINSPKRKLNRKHLRQHQTSEEQILWKAIKSKQLSFWFKRQVSIGPYFVDFYCPQKHLVIEIDGGQHQESTNKEYDIFRSNYLNGLDIKVIRFKNHEVTNNLTEIIEKIKKEIITPT